MQIGVHSGTTYTNFIFLASAKTNLKCDMNLNFQERELVVNFLLLANLMGQFLGLFCSYGYLGYAYPSLLLNSIS